MKKAIDIEDRELSQGILLPLFVEYAKQHLKEFGLHEKDKSDYLLKGCCQVFASVLARACAEGGADHVLFLLKKILSFREPLLNGEKVPQDPQLDSLISTFIKNRFRYFGKLDMVAGAFEDKAFINACELLEKPGDYLAITSFYGVEKDRSHVIAISLKSLTPREYYLIDANGGKEGMIARTGEEKELINFVRSSFHTEETMILALTFCTFDERLSTINTKDFYSKNLNLKQNTGPILDLAVEILKHNGAAEDDFLLELNRNRRIFTTVLVKKTFDEKENLTNSIFQNNSLFRVTFKTDLSGAKFSNSSLLEVDFTEATFDENTVFDEKCKLDSCKFPNITSSRIWRNLANVEELAEDKFYNLYLKTICRFLSREIESQSRTGIGNPAIPQAEKLFHALMAGNNAETQKILAEFLKPETGSSDSLWKSPISRLKNELLRQKQIAEECFSHELDI